MPLLVAAVLVIALFVGSVMAYDDLPSRIPQHFGIDGAPDRWAETSWASWLLLPIVSVAVGALIIGIASIVPRDLRNLNVPNKERLLRLPPERQREAGLIVRNALDWIAVAVLAMFCGIQAEVYLAARNESTTLLALLPVAVIVAIIGIVAGMVVRIGRLSRER